MTTHPRPFTQADFWAVRNIGTVALSPDGRRVAFVVHHLDKESNEQRSAIYLLGLDEQGRAISEPHQLTSGTKNDTAPAWSPDSKHLLFVSNREEKNQLWLINADGGEARKLTNMLRNVNEAAWSPDGRWIAFTASAASGDDDEELLGRKTLEASARKKIEEEQRFSLRREKTIWYRMDGRGRFEYFSQLFLMPAPTEQSSVDPQALRRLSHDEYDHTQLTWTPDSREISVLRNGAAVRDGSWVTDLWCFDSATGEARCLTDGSLEINAYAWSPDGQRAMLAAGYDSIKEGVNNVRLHLLERAGGKPQTLTTDIDNAVMPVAFAGARNVPNPYRPQWSEDGKHVYFVVTERGCVNVYGLDIERRSATLLLAGEQLVFFLAILPAQRGLLLGRDEPLHPSELYLLPFNASDGSAEPLEPLTHLHDSWLAEFVWSKPERLEYESANGDLVDGWLVRPVGAQEGVRYPLLVTIHGGPHSAYGSGMSFTAQRYAAAGFAVFYCNPHGSTGCGEAFLRQVIGNWGALDYQDIMRGVDVCIERGVADPERLAVTGYSYGGFMSMFIIGQTDRFKAAVPMAGVSNLASFVGTSDVGFWLVRESQGAPWEPERAAYYREHSPLTYAPRVTTPTLFLHPENDLRCPIEQSEQFYMTLKMIGKVPTEFIRVPAAWHIGTTKPGQQFSYWEMLLEWLRTYIEVRPTEYTVTLPDLAEE
ncbi:MAG TPA: S9 family peptidase [Ktedonobacteraceae bacterium]|nr:S9 family peptidase [Ktedonobacteraceae bacterium]